MTHKRIWAALGLMALLLTSSAVAQVPGKRSFTIGGEMFTEGDLLDARATPELGGGTSIMLSFAPVAAKRVLALSRTYLGKTMPVLLDGATIAVPTVQVPITDGVLLITGTFALPQAAAIAKSISGRDPLPDDIGE